MCDFISFNDFIVQWIKVSYDFYLKKSLKAVQCKFRLDRKIQPFLVEGVRFTHTEPIPIRVFFAV